MSFTGNAARVATMVTVLAISLLCSANSPRMLASAGSSVSVENQSIRRDAKAETRRSLNQIQTAAVVMRRERLQKVLLALDGIAQATLQLKPETASRLEPVVVDLAEQAIELARDQSLGSRAADQSLLKLEKTVSQLVRTINRFVEPEMSL